MDFDKFCAAVDDQVDAVAALLERIAKLEAELARVKALALVPPIDVLDCEGN